MNPTFVACTARSGSTLLRWLVDAHPEVACPAETDVALLLASLDRTTGALFGPDVPGRNVGARRCVEGFIDNYLTEQSKAQWCDKSLSNAVNLDLLAATWPSAKFIFLHRHVMDFIASALEAQPWGLSEYGFAQYAAQTPGDNVGALARYWLERTSRMLAFERRTGHRTVRLTYEDLVRSPDATLDRVWHLLGVESRSAVFGAPKDSHGAGDHRIWFTSGITNESLDLGARLPPGLIGGTLRLQVNETLTALGYRTIDDSWGAGGDIPGGDGPVQIRIVDGHTPVTSRYRAHISPKAVIAVETGAVSSLVSGELNVGAALRSRQVRYYGPPLTTYGEEQALMAPLPKVLTQMRD